MIRICSAIFILLVFHLAARGQAGKSDISTSTAIAPPSLKVSHGTANTKYGIASYYADKFKGRQTANGDVYLPEKYTAACNVLPLNTWIRVTNLTNNKSVVVKINDRMHARNKRLVDLSKIAAKKINLISYGIIKIKLEVLSGNPQEGLSD